MRLYSEYFSSFSGSLSQISESSSRSTSCFFSSRSSNATASEENGSVFYTHQVVFPLNKRDSTTANIVRTLAKNKLVAVTLDMDGVYRMYGKDNGLYLASTESGSGTAAGDRNGYNITLSGIEKDDFLQVSNAVVLALETAG